MFTVIFVNQRAEQQRKNYQFLFQPFIDANEMCFCPWFTEETSIENAVPDLYRILKGKKEWRAIVLHMDSIDEPRKQQLDIEDRDEEEEEACTYTASDRNPFDYSDVDKDEMPHSSEIPLIRFTHMLAGYDYSPIRDFEDVYEYFNDELDEKRTIPEASFHRFYKIQKNLNDVRVRYKKESAEQEGRVEEGKTSDEILDQHYLFSSYSDERTGKTVRISFDLITKLLHFQSLVFQFDNRYLYVNESGAASEPSIVTKDSLYRICQYQGDDCRISVFQQECIEYFLLHRIEYQYHYYPTDEGERCELNEKDIFIEYVDERLKKTCRVSLNDSYKIQRLFKLKSKNALRLIHLDGHDERELDRSRVFIDNSCVRATRPIKFSIEELENYYKMDSVVDETEIQYLIHTPEADIPVLDKQSLLMECIDSGNPVGERFSVNCIDMFRLLQIHKNELQFSYLPESKRSRTDKKSELNLNDDIFSDYLGLDDNTESEEIHESELSLKSLENIHDIDYDIMKDDKKENRMTAAGDIQFDTEVESSEEYIKIDKTELYLEFCTDEEDVSISLDEIMEIEDVLVRKDELKLTHRAVFHELEQIKKQKELNKKYRFSDNRPLELLLFATRSKSETDEKQVISRAWNSTLETDRTRFWEFNHYPVNCRFLYMDIMSSENYRFEQDLLNYWIAVLLMARNNQGAGCLKAYNLYRIRLDLNEKKLYYALNHQLNILQGAYKNLKFELQCAKDYTFKPNEVLFTRESITVNFDRDQALDMLQREKRSAFSQGNRDEELKELHKNSDKITNEKMMSLKTGNKQRVLDNAVKLIRQRCFEFESEEYLLDDYQIKELQAQKTDYERKLLTNGIYSPEEFEEIQRKSEIENKRLLEEATKARMDNEKTKMTWDVVKTVCLVSLGLIVVGNGTYIVQSAMQSDATSENIYNLFISILVTFVIVLLAAACAYYVFRQYSHELEHRENEFKNTVSTVQKSDEPFEQKYGSFYSDLLTYLKLQAMYAGMDARKKNDIASHRRLLEYSRAIQGSLERNEKWLRLFGLDRMALKKVYLDGFKEAPIKNPMFYFETAGEDEFVRLNEHEQMISAYPFIEHVWIERDYLSDDSEETDIKG